jgi:hypothetical protein
VPNQEQDAESGDTDRYEKAARAALALLDWCIEYFRHEDDDRLAEQLTQNRRRIRRNLTGEWEHW